MYQHTGNRMENDPYIKNNIAYGIQIDSQMKRILPLPSKLN